MGSVEYKDNYQLQMNNWIDGRKTYTLLNKATRDWCSAMAFHIKCNNRGTTITLLYNINGSVFAGCTSVSWRSAGTYHTDPHAFLFRLNQNGMLSFDGNNTIAIYDYDSCCTTFGGEK